MPRYSSVARIGTRAGTPIWDQNIDFSVAGVGTEW